MQKRGQKHELKTSWNPFFDECDLFIPITCLQISDDELDTEEFDSVFESAGLLAACTDCGHLIACGVLHSGFFCEVAEGLNKPDVRAEHPLRFCCNPVVSGTRYVSDHRAVTTAQRISAILLFCGSGGIA